MRKTFDLEDLDCAHCAAKMEEGVRKLAGVDYVAVNFLAQKMVLEAADDKFDAVLKEAIAVCKKIEPDCEIVL